MRICFVGPSNSAHIIKWCNWFSKRGHEVHVISFTNDKIESAIVHSINIGVDPNGSDVSKLKYLFTGKQIKIIINEIKPDIINAHYATSYGIAMALSGVKKYILSVWGSDIYDFPNRSMLHKELLKFSLKKATILFSTSQAMSDEASKYTNKKFYITPFGVDMSLFNPNNRTRIIDGKNELIVGTVKGLTEKYGISHLLKAVSIIKRKTNIPIKLIIAGKGEQAKDYFQLAHTLGIEDITEWLGYVSQDVAAKVWANMDIAIIPSTLDSESFGVSAVEAEASGIPVIISDVPGLMEATKPNYTSFVVKRCDSKQIADKIIELYNNPDLRVRMGKHGREYVEKLYELNSCFEHIEKIYDGIVIKIDRLV